jgi:hypothetical protein
LGAVNDILSDVTYNEEMRDGLMRLQRYIKSMVEQYGNVMNLLSVKITLESHTARVLDGINVLRHLDIILDSLVDAQQGILHPQIIPHHLIVDALVRDSPYFPPATSPLITLSKDSTHLLHGICEVYTYIHNNVLEYVIVLPLVNKGTYDVLRLIPISVTLGEGKFVYIDAGKDILCFERARQHYFTIIVYELVYM